MRKILIVGGVAGGASAAARLRRLNEEDQIIMFEKDEFISFANCGLPYYIGDVIKDRDKLFVQTIEGMSARFNLDIRNFSEVIEIDRANKTVRVKNHQSGESYNESYDKLILSPGASPFVPPIDGLADAQNVFTLRNIPDTDKIKEMVNKNPKKAVVIGGGFIGVEMAENFAELGIDTTLVERNSTVMSAPFDFEMAAMINNELTRNGVTLELDVAVTHFSENGKKIHFEDGRTIESDLTIMAIGVRPKTELAVQSGLELGITKAIKVNEKLQTSDPNIYAVGDAVEVMHRVSNQPTYIPLAWPANRQGRLVADIINGKNVTYKGTLGTSVAKVFNQIAASTGLTEKKARELYKDVESAIVHRANHAGYYPNSQNIALKLIFNKKTGEIYGAQAFGGEGTEKRIDVLATAIIGKLTVFDLPELELAYAPPFSSAKDPVNIVGYVASNIIEDNLQTFYVEDPCEISQDAFFIDVRTKEEFELGHIENTVNMPIDALRTMQDDLPKDKSVQIYITCQVGQRGHLAARMLKNLGYNNIANLSGGYKTFSECQQSKKKRKTRD